MKAHVSKPAKAHVSKPAGPAVTLELSELEFRLLDAIQYHYLGGGLNECYEINNAFRKARKQMKLGILRNLQTDHGLGAYFDASKALDAAKALDAKTK